MLKYFSHRDNLSDVLLYVTRNDSPQIIVSEYNCILDNRTFFRDDGNELDVKIQLETLLNSEKVVEFILFDNKHTLEEIKDGLQVNQIYEAFIKQNETSKEFIEGLTDIIKHNGCLWSITLDDRRKNNLLHELVRFHNSTNIKISILFSSFTDALSYILTHDHNPKVEIIVFDIQKKYTPLKDQIINIIKNESVQ